MFNWIQTSLIKHYKWFMVLLLGVMIVAFVFTIGNFSPWGNNGPTVRSQPFLSHDLSTAQGSEAVFGRGQLSLTLIYPSFFGPPSESMVVDYSLSRAGFLHMADQIGLPGPTKDQLKEHIQSLNGFMDFSTQAFDQTRFSAFVSSLETTGLTEAYLTSVLKDDYRVQKLQELLGGPGYILPVEAIHATQDENTEWTLETARLAYNEFQVEIEPTQEELESFYTNNSFRYAVDTRAKASYLKFDPADYVDNEYIPEAGEKSIHFFTNKARYQAAIPAPAPIEKEDGTTETPKAPEVTLTDVEDQVIEEIRNDRANKKAQEVAEAFAYKLFDSEIENGSEAFDAAISEASLALKELVPYPQSAVIMQDGLTNQTLGQVFNLNDSRYFSDPIQNGNEYVILIYQGEEPAYTPELPEILAKVTSDFIEEQKRAKFTENGATIKEAVQKALADGQSFADAAKAQNLTHQAFEAFKKNATPPTGFGADLVPQLENLNESDVSDWVSTATEGVLVFAVKKSVPELTSESEEVIAYLERQKASTSNVQFIMQEMMAEALSGTQFAQENAEI